MPKAASKPALIPIVYGLAQFELADVGRLVAWFESIANAKKKASWRKASWGQVFHYHIGCFMSFSLYRFI
jgi:hypothetical protein